MRSNQPLALAAPVLLVALALIAMAGFRSHASAAQGNSDNAQRKAVTVKIRDFKFEPETVTVQANDTVEWKNEDALPHTATADADAQRPAFDSGNIQTGGAWRYVARDKGTYNYTCTIHPYMKGKLIVQ